jgi:hypothetical protein
MIHAGAVAHGVGPLEIRTAGKVWIVGTGDVAGRDEASWHALVAVDATTIRPDTPVAGSVATTRFELFRAATGRRSEAQIRGFEWSVDPEPYLPIFGYGPFKVRSTNLDE